MASQKDRDRLKELNEQLRFLLGIKPQGGVYLFENVRYNKRGYDDLVKKTRQEIADLQEKVTPADTTSESNRLQNLSIRADRLSTQYDDLAAKLIDIEQAAGRAGSVEEETNLRNWASLIQNSLRRMDTAIKNLRNGVEFSDPPIPAVPSVQQARRAGPPGPATGQTPVAPVGQGFTPAPGQGIFGEQVATTPTGGNAPVPGVVYGGMGATGTAAPIDLSSVNFPETPAGTTTTPSGTTGTTPGTVATPTPAPAGTTGGPAFTEPATGTTYQPGERIGGEDRTLPNGGAVVDGVYIPPGVDYTWLANQVPEDWKTAAQELYGAYYDMIKNDPQISKLLEDAIKLGYSDAKFQAELEKTDWWRKTTANARQFQVLETTDPATARAQLDNRIALVRETAQRLGVTLAATSLESIARNAINLGFDLTAQVEDLVGSEAIRSAGGVSQLRFGYVGNSIRESARKFGVALSDVTFNEWVNKIAVGAESTETFESYAQQISRTLYPSLAAGYDRGLTFAQLTDPYAQQASRILEIPASQVDFTDPKWAQAFTMKDEKGNPTQMSYGEWADYLRTNPSFGWEYTDDAKNRAYTVVNRLAELFGAA